MYLFSPWATIFNKVIVIVIVIVIQSSCFNSDYAYVWPDAVADAADDSYG